MSTSTAATTPAIVSLNGRNYELYWPAALSESERAELLNLYDEVARHEGTHGYSGSISNEMGRRIVDAEAESLASGQIYMLLVRDVDGLVGSFIMQPYVSEARGHTINSKKAVVARRARGVFVPLMFGEGVRKAVSLGAEVVTLDVAEDGPVKLWKSLGFKEYGVLDDYARRHGKSLKGYFLYLNLPSNQK
jgi:hypothetical protein